MNHSRMTLLIAAVALPLVVAGCRKAPAPAVQAAVPEEPPAPASPLETVLAAPGPKDEGAAEGFRFPEDPVGEKLSKLLPPEKPAVVEMPPSAPRPLPGSPTLEEPSVPLLPNQGQVPRLAEMPRRMLRPRSLAEERPLAGQRNALLPPEELQLSVGERVRLPGPDVNQPVPPPMLGRPAPERVLPDEATADFSAEAVRTAVPPGRAAAAPFVRLALPDPFEHRNAVRLRTLPADDGGPVTAGPRLPGK